MAELRTLARPYAKAVFQVASEQNNTAGWSENLALLKAVTGHQAVARLIASPSMTAGLQIEKLAGLLGDDIDDSTKNFLTILAENKRLPLLPQIADLYEELKAQKERSVDVSISAAYPLDEQTESKLAAALREKLQRDIKVKTSIDKSLLGGVLVKAGDIVIDGSIKGRLAKLAGAMIR